MTECYRRPIVPPVQAGPRLPLRVPSKVHVALPFRRREERPEMPRRTPRPVFCHCFTASVAINTALVRCWDCGGLR